MTQGEKHDQIPDRAVLLLAGIPASGKTTFADWLAKRSGFVHLDVDRIGYLPPGILAGKDPRVIVDWGFPPAHLDAVKGLRDRGAQLWWFDGDRKAAREAFFRRPSSPPARYYERQMAAIQGKWTQIEAVFSGRIINTIDATGTYLRPETILERIFPART